MTTKSVFTVSDSNRGLINPFTYKIASQQAYDLLKFCSIGPQDYLLRISYYNLEEPSIETPNRKQCLQTGHQTEGYTAWEGLQAYLQCMRKMKWSQRTGQPIERPGEQLWRSFGISRPPGRSHQGQKSYMTKGLETRYKSSPATTWGGNPSAQYWKGCFDNYHSIGYP